MHIFGAEMRMLRIRGRGGAVRIFVVVGFVRLSILFALTAADCFSR